MLPRIDALLYRVRAGVPRINYLHDFWFMQAHGYRRTLARDERIAASCREDGHLASAALYRRMAETRVRLRHAERCLQAIHNRTVEVLENIERQKLPRRDNSRSTRSEALKLFFLPSDIK
jgi:hypothetical protein